MLYHLNHTEQENILENSKRILGPNGIFIATTSSKTNKHGHRRVEADIAKTLGIKPPEFMNSSFTSETAAKMLPQTFKEVYRADVAGKLRRDNLSEAERLEILERYLGSQISLADQYTPSQKNNPRFQKIAREFVEIAFSSPSFKDSMHRTIFIASQSKITENPFIEMNRCDLDFQKLPKATSFL